MSASDNSAVVPLTLTRKSYGTPITMDAGSALLRVIEVAVPTGGIPMAHDPEPASCFLIGGGIPTHTGELEVQWRLVIEYQIGIHLAAGYGAGERTDLIVRADGLVNVDTIFRLAPRGNCVCIGGGVCPVSGSRGQCPGTRMLNELVPVLCGRKRNLSGPEQIRGARKGCPVGGATTYSPLPGTSRLASQVVPDVGSW